MQKNIVNKLKFNQFVVHGIREREVCKMYDGHDSDVVICFEPHKWDDDDNMLGFVAFREDEPNKVTYGDTPYEAYCSMPPRARE
jgi:hypothetical protein